MRTIRTIGTSLVAQVVKSLSTVLETQVRSLGLEDLLEKGMATHSSILAPSPQKGAQRRTMGVFREYFWCAWHYDMTWYVSLFVITATQKRKCFWGLPRWHSGEESACQYRRHRRCSFNPWVRKIPWRRKLQPISVFLPGISHEQRSLAGASLKLEKGIICRKMQPMPGHMAGRAEHSQVLRTHWPLLSSDTFV